MRSEYVFAASKEISNRFMLCRVTSVSARRLQVGSRQASETINKSLNLIAAAELTQGKLANEQAAPTEVDPAAHSQALPPGAVSPSIEQSGNPDE
jgi:DNA-directed RNA polymerase subunit K/omega